MLKHVWICADLTCVFDCPVASLESCLPLGFWSISLLDHALPLIPRKGCTRRTYMVLLRTGSGEIAAC